MRRLAILLLLTACAGSEAAPKTPASKSQQLVVAVRAGDSAVVARILSDDISPDTLAPDGTRPLTEAVRNGRVVIMRQLLAADAKVDLKDSVGNTAWDYAIENGHPNVAAQLVWQAAQEAGASAEANQWFAAVAAGVDTMPAWSKSMDGELESLGLLYAAIQGRTGVVSSMRHGGGIPNRTGMTALAMAARFGARQIVEMLLAAGANPNLQVKDRWESTPLMLASRDGHIEVARMLLRAGARVDLRDISGGTALHWAVRSGQTAFARTLLEGGADPNVPEWSGDKAVDLARSINHPDLIALLESWRGGRR